MTMFLKFLPSKHPIPLRKHHTPYLKRAIDI
jgi:hypothetical protein